MANGSVAALYIHVPFCVRKCAYCDFASAACPADDPGMDAYLKRLLEDLDRASAGGLVGACATAYIGGGTPTHLGPARLRRLIAAVSTACPALSEFSCEANPDSLGDAVLDALASSGVTRISVGVQSLVDAELAALGRVHTAATARERVAAAVATGLDVSVDLMCAVPHQTDASWLYTLNGVLGLGVGHVSVYPLSLEEGTPLGDRFGAEGLEPAPWNDEDVQAERMEESACVLGAAGYARYEVASYARLGKQCAHNRAYWTGVPYLGLGPGAASMLDTAQYAAARRLWPQLAAVSETATRVRFAWPYGARASEGPVEAECLSAREAWAEDLMLGMRLTCGIDASLLDDAPQTRDDLIARRLVARRGHRLVPTHDGWLLGNELFGALWDLAETDC